MLSTGCSARCAFFTTFGVAARLTVRTGCAARRILRGTNSRDRNPISPPCIGKRPPDRDAYPDRNVHQPDLTFMSPDVSTSVTFDIARNQLARTIDVMLEDNQERPGLDQRLALTKAGTYIPGLADTGPHATIGQRASAWQEQAVWLAHAGVAGPRQRPPAPAPSAPQ